MKSHQVNLNLADFIHLKPQCSSDHELVGHDHGSENNAADWDGYDTMIQLQEKLGFNLSEIGCLLDFVRDNYR
mgnify:FL=1